MFDKRVHYAAEVGSVEELAEKVADGRTWTLCTGWELNGLLFLNDSTCEDGAGEWAVVIPDPDRKGGEQIESITFGWAKRHEAIEHIRACLNMKATGKRPGMSHRVALHLDHPSPCRLCA